MSGHLYRKAARLVVAPNVDGSFSVAGDTGTRLVRSLGFGEYWCSCPSKVKQCSHILSVIHYQQSVNRKDLSDANLVRGA